MDGSRLEMRSFRQNVETSAIKRTAQELCPVDCTVLLLGYCYEHLSVSSTTSKCNRTGVYPVVD